MQDLEGFDFFQPMAGLPLGDGGAAAQERSTSSGFIISADGFVLSSAHAVFDAHQTWVTLSDGRRFQATVIGLERSSDVALLKVDAQGLPVAPLAPAAGVCPGDWVAALGAPFGFEQTVTVGVVSAYPRFLLGGAGMPLIQTDAVLNPGSSGGPLFDARGLVVGMNSMIFSSSGIYIGVSFTLPIDRVLRIAADLRSGRARGYVGLRTQPVTPELAQAFGLAGPGGALVTRVTAAGPAERAGLRSGDILLSVDGVAIASPFQLEDLFAAARPGSSLALQVWRDGTLQRMTVGAAAAPRDPLPATSTPTLGQGRLGLEFAPAVSVSGMAAGVHVESASGAGLLAGIEPGDRITAVNGQPVASAADFDAALQAAGSGKAVALLVTRGTAQVYIPVMRP